MILLVSAIFSRILLQSCFLLQNIPEIVMHTIKLDAFIDPLLLTHSYGSNESSSLGS